MKTCPGTSARNPLFLVSYPQGTHLKDVRNIRYVCFMRIKWDRFKNTRKVTQRHRCRGFGHGTTGCHVKPKCVKCAGEHLSSQCTVALEKPKYANCQGNHTANYTGCQAYKDCLNSTERSLRSKIARTKEPQQRVAAAPAVSLQPQPQYQGSHQGRQETYASGVHAAPASPRVPQNSQTETQSPELPPALNTAQHNHAEILELNATFTGCEKSSISEKCNSLSKI